MGDGRMEQYTNKAKAGRNQSGQAVVEYVLILVVALALGTLALKLNEGFKSWGNSIVNGRTTCQLETGQLNPSGVDCVIADVDVTFPSGSSGGLSSSSGASGSGSSSSSDSSSSSSGTTDSTGSSTDRGTSDSGELHSEPDPSVNNESENTDSSGRNRRGKGKTSSSNDKGYDPNGNTIAIHPEDRLSFGKGGGGSEQASQASRSRKREKKRKITFSSGGANYTGEPGYAGERHQAILSGGWMEQDEQKKRSKPIPVQSRNVASKKNTITGSQKRSRFLINKKAKTKDKDVKVGKWSFGNIFRVILIICVIVSIVLLIASQSYSVKKSMK